MNFSLYNQLTSVTLLLFVVCFVFATENTEINTNNVENNNSNNNNNNNLGGFSKHGFGKHDANTKTKSNCLAYVSDCDEHGNLDPSLSPHIIHNNPYEHEIMISSYKHFHYWDEKYFNVNNFPQSVALFAINVARNYSKTKEGSNYEFNTAMDVGCAVGRISLELTNEYKHVTGLDFSNEMINVANEFITKHELQWSMANEGDIFDDFKVSLINDLKLSKFSDNNGNNNNNEFIHFQQNDALNLDPKFDNFNLIVASNLIDRLNNPRKFLSNIWKRLEENNGILVICTPYTWLEQYTDKSEWIGGFYEDSDNDGNDDNNEPIFGKDTMEHIFKSEGLTLLEERNIEMVFRETKWEYVHSISHCTAWHN